MALIDITKFDGESNFWELFPQLKYIKPYSDLYEFDQTDNKTQSSKDMWVIALLMDPSPDNKFYRINPLEKRLDMLKETYHSLFDKEHQYVKPCFDNYTKDNLDEVERAFKDEVDSLIKRSLFLSSAEYTFDDTEKDINGNTIFVSGKPMVKKGTAADIDRMRANTLKIYQQYEATKEIFDKHKQEARVHGGRKESMGEKNLI